MYLFLHTLQNTLLLLSCLTILKSCEVFHQWWQLFLVDADRAVGPFHWVCSVEYFIDQHQECPHDSPSASLVLDLPQQCVLRAWVCPPGSWELPRQRWHMIAWVCVHLGRKISLSSDSMRALVHLCLGHRIYLRSDGMRPWVYLRLGHRICFSGGNTRASVYIKRWIEGQSARSLLVFRNRET